MFGFFIGALSVIGLLSVVRGVAWRRYGHHHGCGGGYGRRSRRRGFEDPGMGRAASEILKRRLRIDEDQEDLVDHALSDLRAAVTESARSVREARGPLAEAFRGEEVDEAAITATLSRLDEQLAQSRREAISAFKQVHAVLTADQRKRAVDSITNAHEWKI